MKQPSNRSQGEIHVVSAGEARRNHMNFSSPQGYDLGRDSLCTDSG